MLHVRSVTRKPVKAQSAYASKLEFKQAASTTIAFNSALLLDGITTIGSALFVNALSLGTIIEIITGTDDNTES